MPTPSPSPVPQGMQSVTTQLWFAGNCADAIAFYGQAFGAEPVMPPIAGPGGKGVMHALLQVGSNHVMMADAWPGGWETAPESCATASLMLYVDDVDAAFARAVEAGCEVMFPVADMF